jgi:hypothetical protein
MRTFFVLFIILFLFSNIKAQVANKIDKLDVNQLRLPKESVSKATYIDATGQVKSSNISNTELGYLSGLTELLTTSLTGKANDADVVKLTGNQSVSGIKTFTGKIVASSTTNGSIPCPVMTEVQRDAFTPESGDCVYNSTTLKLNVFDGSVWKDVGGAGGISLWLTANPYNVNDIVIESDKIYRCLIAHTSGTFATDLAASKWVEVSQGLTSPVSLADGGTGTSITASPGSIVYVDADSFEIVSGTSGQILQSNGTSAPSFVNKSILGKSQQDVSSSTLEEVQAPNKLLTQVSSNKYLNETGNKNILSNPSFEHSTFSTDWVNSAGTFTEETSVIIDGKKSAKLVLSAQTMALSQSSTLYSSQFADGIQGLASVRIKSDVALKVCSIQAGTISTTNCVNTVSNNKWGLYKVPMILGATSNGISIASTGSVSGTVYIDEAFVGATDLTQNINACNDVSCETEFSASVSSAGVVSNENLDWLTLTSHTLNSGIYTFSINSSVSNTLPMNCVATDAGVNTTERVMVIRSVTLDTLVVGAKSASDGTTLVDVPFTLVCQKQGSDFLAGKRRSTGEVYSTITGPESVDIFSAKISSAGLTSSENSDFINGNCTLVDAGDFTCNFNAGTFTQIPNCVISSGQNPAALEDVTVGIFKSLSTTQAQIKLESVSNTEINIPFTLMCQKQGVDFVASKVIVGSFKDIPTIPNSVKPVTYIEEIDCVASSSLVRSLSNSSIFQSIGNISSGNCAFTLKSGLFTDKPYCFGNFSESASSAVSLHPVFTTNTTGVLQCRSGTGACATGGKFNISCTGISP